MGFSKLQITSCSPLVFSVAFEPYSGPLETCTRIHEEATEAKPQKPEKKKCRSYQKATEAKKPRKPPDS